MIFIVLHRCVGWTAADTALWRQYFEKSGPYTIKERPPFSIENLRPHTGNSVVAKPKANMVPISQIPEPMVCTTSDAATAWTTARASVRQFSRSTRMPGDVLKSLNSQSFQLHRRSDCRLFVTHRSGVKKGDILVIFPDDASMELDRAKGYFLAASFGKVVKIVGIEVIVNWLFAEAYSSKLRPWMLADGAMYTDTLDETSIFTGDTDSVEPLKAALDKNKRLTKVTKDAIISVIGIDEFNKYA
jgi:hypothetical protein